MDNFITSWLAVITFSSTFYNRLEQAFKNYDIPQWETPFPIIKRGVDFPKTEWVGGVKTFC